MKRITLPKVNWPVFARDFSGLIGAGLVAYGVSEIYRPAGFIVLGLLLLSAAALSARASA